MATKPRLRSLGSEIQSLHIIIHSAMNTRLTDRLAMQMPLLASYR